MPRKRQWVVSWSVLAVGLVALGAVSGAADDRPAPSDAELARIKTEAYKALVGSSKSNGGAAVVSAPERTGARQVPTAPPVFKLLFEASKDDSRADVPPAPEKEPAPAKTQTETPKDPVGVAKSGAGDEKLGAPKIGPNAKTEAPKVLSKEATTEAAVCEPHFTVHADYLLWWIRRGPSPALVTTGTVESGGVLGVEGTSVLFGQNDLDFGTFSGARAGATWNFGDDQFWGLDISGFILQKRHNNFAATSDAKGNPLLAQPFLSSLDTSESSVAISVPGQLAGNIAIRSDTQLWGWDANLIARSVRDGTRRVELLGGIRSMGLDESLHMEERFTTLEDDVAIFQKGKSGENVDNIIHLPKGAKVLTLDDFATRNRFYGGQLGARFEWNFGRVNFDLTGKVAFGVTHQTATIFGLSTLTNGPAGDENRATLGGVYALRTNIGRYERDQFSVVPEIGLNAWVDITSRIRAKIGYSGLYWSAAARPGDQIDRALNQKLIPTGQDFSEPFDPKVEQARPRFQFTDNGFWAQGLNVGVEIRY